MARTANEVFGVGPALTDLDGRAITVGADGTTPQNYVDGTTVAMVLTADVAVIAAQGAGVRIYVTSLIVTNNHATVVTDVQIKDGATVKATVRPALGTTVVVSLPTPLRLTANTALNAANVTTGSSVIVAAVGYKATI